MSSSSSLATVRARLNDALTPLVPEGWEIVPKLATRQAALTPVLYLEFHGITTQDGGQTAPFGAVYCQLDAVVVIPSDIEDDVDVAVLELILALDGVEDVVWRDAKKERLATGELAWRIPLSTYAKKEA